MGKKRDSIKGCCATAYITVEGEAYLWYKVEFLDEAGKEKKITWFLPKEKTDEYVQNMLSNIGKRMSDYIYANPDSSLVKSILNKV